MLIFRNLQALDINNSSTHTRKVKRGRILPSPFAVQIRAVYGTVKGRMPSVGKIPVGPAAVDGCERNRKRMKKPAWNEE